jgi:hypothetical protein
MSDEKIAEIRARHNYTEEMWWAADDPCANQAHADRAALLAEVERLREVIRTIRARCVELDDSDAVSEVLDISRTALGDEP